jgi:hypothetical protein
MKLLTEIFCSHEHRPVESPIKKHEPWYCGKAILYDGKIFKRM